MLLSALVTNTKVRLGNHPTADTTLIERIANEEAKALAKSFYFDSMQFEETAVSVADTATLAVATSGYYLIESVYDSTNDYNLEIRDEEWYNAQLTFTETGIPLYFVQRLSALYLYQIPDAVYSYKIRGRKVPATTTSAQELPYPEEWHLVIECMTASRIASMLKMNEVMMATRNEALSRISTITENRTSRRRITTGQIQVERRGGSY
jgi:hypothetical protein